MRLTYIIATLAVTASLSACQRTTYTGFNQGFNQPVMQSQPLQPAPVAGVDRDPLSPLDPNNPANQPTTIDPNVQSNIEVAAANSELLTREEMIGGWKIVQGPEFCNVFLSLTKRSTDYRAASRGCSGTVSSVTGWNVEGKQVVLNDSNGNNIARLYKTAKERFDGSSSEGSAIQLSR